VRELSIVQSTVVDHYRALPKTCKKLGVLAENVLLKALDGVLHHISESVFVETSRHRPTYSLS